MKRQSTAFWLAILLGSLGSHRFYLGQPRIGMVYLLFCWTLIPTVVSVFEGIVLVTMPQQEFNMRYNRHFWM